MKHAFALLMVAGALFAQSEKGALRGTVTDPSGAVVVDATVTITQVTTNIEARQIKTDSAGNYEAPDLTPMSYRLTVEVAGFRKFVIDNILLDPGQIRRVDAKLAMGSSADTITVEAGAALIETESGAISGQVDTKLKYQQAPQVDIYPSPLSLLTTTPSIQGNGWRMVMSGISDREKQTWALDGVANDTNADQNNNPNYFETIEVTPANGRADAARAASFNMVSKHGTNDFHGSAYWKEANSAFNARSFFDKRKTPFIQHEFEAEAGGHIIKDRTFYYVGWTYQKMPLGSTAYASVPTDAMRSGDFSAFLNPQTSPNRAITRVNDPTTGQPFAGNQIPASRVNGVAQKYLEYYPSPNLGGTYTYSQNYTWAHPYNYDNYKGNWPFIRIDHKLSDKNTFYLRYMLRQTPYIWAGGVGERFNSTQYRDHRGMVASDTWVISASVVNTLTLGHTTDLVKYGEKEQNVQPMYGDEVVKALGLQGVNTGGFHTAGFPAANISGVGGVSSLSMRYDGGYKDDISRDDGINTISDSVTWAKGKHIVKVGGEFRHFWVYSGGVSSQVYGAFTFDGTMTGSGFGDFLLGIPHVSQRLNPNVPRRAHQNQVGWYVTDTFKITSRLTLDYGLRWDYYPTAVYNDGLMYNFDPAANAVVIAKGTRSRVSPLYPTSLIKVIEGDVVASQSLANYRPRASVAYRINDKTVLRGGYGEFTSTYGYFNPMNNGGPFQMTETYNNSLVNGSPMFSFPNPFPSSLATASVPGQTITAIPRHMTNGVLRQFNFTIERQVKTLGLRASYIGTRGSDMLYSLNINKAPASTLPFATSRLPFPQFSTSATSGVTQYRDDGAMRYNSLQGEIKKRAGSLTFNSSFTWSSDMNNYSQTQDPSHSANWARDAVNRRLYFVASAVWELPFGKGQRWLSHAPSLVNGAIGNWSLQAIGTLASGQYFSPWFTGPDPAHSVPGNVTALPDCVGNPTSGISRGVDHWFNPAAFAAPPANAGRYGNCGVNVLESYPLHVAHVSLSKTFPITERVKTAFTAQISNITNSPGFTTPQSNITNGNAGAFLAGSVQPYYAPERQGYRQIGFKLRVAW